MNKKGKAMLGLLAGLLCLAVPGLNVQAEGGRNVPHYTLGDREGDLWEEEHFYLPDGTMVQDAFFCDGTYTYYLMWDGTPMKNRLSYHPDGEHVIYLDAEGHEVFSNFTHVKQSIAGEAVDDLCFFDVFGYMYVDVLTYDQAGENLYYANPYGVMERNGWFEFSSKYKGGYGYANPNGILMTDQYTYDWNGNMVYMEADGHIRGSMIQEPEETPKPGAHTERVELSNMRWRIDEYNEAGQKIKATSYDAFGSIGNWSEYEYNEAGQEIKETKYNADGGIGSWSEYEYNEAGLMIKKTQYKANGSIGGWSEYEYNEAGLMIKEMFYYANDDSAAWWYEYEYNEAGLMIKDTIYHTDGSKGNWSEYEYNEAGQKIKDTVYNPNGSISIWSEYEYNEADQMIKQTRYYASGGSICTEYNKAGQMIKRKAYNADGSISSWTEFEYNEAGQWIKTTDYNTDGSISYWCEYEYNEAGQRIKDTFYNTDGSISSWYEYEYNEVGQKINSTKYNADGTVSQ